MAMEEQPRQNIGQTVKAYSRRLFGFIRGKVNTDEDAEDILQDVWYQLSNVVNINDIQQMSGWLFRVAKNKIIDRYRKKETDALEDWMTDDPENEFVFPGFITDRSDGPETAFLREMFWEALMNALEELPENQRQVFVLNEMEDMTLREIADKTGENIKTIISRKGYAVKHLRKRLESVYEEFLTY
jgi:RNA polymerase sigma factor (sigma-70 family)